MSDLLRMTGMNSGMDTDSVVHALVAAKRTNVDKAKKAQKKLEWKQEAWKELNSKIYGLYSGKVSTMRFSEAYSKKVTKTTNSALTVIPGANAVNGVQTAKIRSIAKAGYLTGGELASDVTNETLLTDLGIREGSTFSITCGDNTKEIEVTADMTVASLTAALKESGVNANFDEVNKRFFISSPATGTKNDFTFSAAAGSDGEDALGILKLTGSDARKTDASDAILELNGATFKSDKNSFNINGSTYNVSAATGNEEITVTTENDTSGIYDMIKSFLKEYNETIGAMAKAYNADAAKGYEPLTDEERESLTDKQADDWEKKVKDALLRKDSTLNEVMNAMRDAMSAGVEINGKTYFLSDFGIGTQGYFEADANERYAYHIDGDIDDSVSGGKADVLKSMIATDPELVSQFFSKLSSKLYDNMYEKMGSSQYSSIYKVYNDKQMKEEYNSYTSKIAELEKKLSDYEDRYYKRFSKMETALSKLNSSQNALSGLFNSLQ